MNTACKTVVSAAVLSLLSACATTAPDAAFRQPRAYAQDNAYVAAIEDRAAHAPERVEVIWVNPPGVKTEE